MLDSKYLPNNKQTKELKDSLAEFGQRNTTFGRPDRHEHHSDLRLEYFDKLVSIVERLGEFVHDVKGEDELGLLTGQFFWTQERFKVSEVDKDAGIVTIKTEGDEDRRIILDCSIRHFSQTIGYGEFGDQTRNHNKSGKYHRTYLNSMV